jgi:hypothetical protein
MTLDVSENDSIDSWLGYTFGDDAVTGSSPLKGRVSEPTCVGLDVGGVRWMFSSIDHMLGFREEPFMKDALDSRATSRESSAVAEGEELDWTRCCISLVRVVASGSVEPTGGPSIEPDATTGMGLWCSRRWHEVYNCYLASKHQSMSLSNGEGAWSNRSAKKRLVYSVSVTDHYGVHPYKLLWCSALSHRYFCTIKTQPRKFSQFLIPLAKMLVFM